MLGGAGAMPTTGVVKSVPFTSVPKIGVEARDRDFGRGGRNSIYAPEGRGRSVRREGSTSGSRGQIRFGLPLIGTRGVYWNPSTSMESVDSVSRERAERAGLCTRCGPLGLSNDTLGTLSVFVAFPAFISVPTLGYAT